MVKEAANLKKHNLFTDNKDLVSQSSRSSLSSPSPSVSTPDSPAMSAACPVKSSFEPQPPSPLVANCLKRISQVKEIPAANQKDQTVKAEEENAPVELETSALADTTTLIEMHNVAAAPETVVRGEVNSVKTAAEPETQSTDALKEAEIVVSEVPTVKGSIKTGAEEAAAAQADVPVPSPDTTNETVTTTTGSLQVTSSDGETLCESSEVTLEAPPSGEAPALAPEDVNLDMTGDEPVSVSDPNSLDVSVGSESPVSDLESIEEAKVTQSCEDQVSTASDGLGYEAHVSKSPVSLDGKATSDTPSPQPQVEAASRDDGVSGGTEAGATVNVAGPVEATATTTSQSSRPAEEEAPSSSASRPPDCIKEIRDLVVEVFEVEEPVQHYPSGVPTEE